MGALLDPPHLQRAFRADGFVSIADFLDAEQVATVRAAVDRVLREVVPTMPAEQVYREDPADPSTLKQLQRLHEHDPALRRWILDGPVAELAAILLDDEPAAQNLQYFDKAPGHNRPTPSHPMLCGW